MLPAHVQLGDGHGNVVDREASLQEEILPHVGQGGGRVDGVPPHPVPLQVRGGVTSLEIRKYFIKLHENISVKENISLLTLDMMMPAMEILTLGP